MNQRVRTVCGDDIACKNDFFPGQEDDQITTGVRRSPVAELERNSSNRQEFLLARTT
jgi:hypothetical protein